MQLAETLAFLTEHYAALLAFVVVAYASGNLFLNRQIIPAHGDRIFLCTSFGMGIVILITFFMALFHQFTRLPVAIALLIAPSCAAIKMGLPDLASTDFRALFQRSKMRLAWFIPLAALTAPLLLVPLYPPITWDEIAAHLPWAKNYVQNAGLSYNIFLRYPLYPQNVDLLYALSLLFYDDILAHLMHALTAIMTAIGIYCLGKITFDRKTGTIAVIIFLSSPIVVLRLMRTSYIDLGLMLFVFLAFYCITTWTISRKDCWLYAAAVATGIAAGTKQLGLMYVVIYTVWVTFESTERRLATTAKFLLFSLAVGAPWYIRSYFISGDPFHPFGGNLFGYWLWNKTDMAGQAKDLLRTAGTPRTLPSLLRLPFNLIFEPKFHGEGAIGPAMVAAFGGIFLFPRFGRFARILTLFVLVNVLIWFFSSQILRYLVPVFPMIALLAARVLLDAYETLILRPASWLLAKARTLPASAIKGVNAAALLVLIQPNLMINRSILAEFRDDPVPVTEQMRARYITARIPAYPFLQIANQAPHLNIYQLGFENSFYYAEGIIMGDWFGIARYSEVSPHLSNPQRLHETLTAMKAHLFLVNKERGFAFTCDSACEPYFATIVETPEAALYAVR